MDFIIDNLIIEFSRKCNLKCEHCLRGNAQNKGIKAKVYTNFLKQLDGINNLTVGGGESSLMTKELKEFRLNYVYALKDNLDIHNVYIVTNGKYITQNVLETYADMFNLSCDGSNSKIGFSFDMWHTYELDNVQIGKRENNYNKAIDYFINENLMVNCYGEQIENVVFKHSDKSWDYGNLYEMGRAADNGIGTKEEIQYKILIEKDEYCTMLRDTSFYLSIDGLLFGSCDLSYKEMTKNSKWFICDTKTINNNQEIVKACEEYNKNIGDN